MAVRIDQDKRHEFIAVVDLDERADYKVEVRHRISVEFPSHPSKRSATRQLHRAYQQGFTDLSHNTAESRRSFHVRPLDGKTGKPDLFPSGLLDFRQARLAKQQAERLERRLRTQVTCL